MLNLLLRLAGPLALASSVFPSYSPKLPPRLVVVIIVDQMRGDYLERFRTQWTGGFARLLKDGSVFPHGLQDHAITETAPGHATILSGRDPGHVGIATNSRGVPDPEAPLVGGGGPGASPRRFIGTALYDWMLARDSGARVLAVSKKDRGAILPVGRARGQVYWYAGTRFTTSRYYADTLPGWVQEFNRREGPRRLAGTRWKLLLPDSNYRETDDMPYENGGRDRVFPHQLPASPDSAALALPDYPWMDSLTLDFALNGAGRLGLGRRNRPDLLVVGLSALDYVGHSFGPDSREIHDHLLHLDRWLGWFLDSLATQVPKERILVVLTADHGVTPFPELAARHGTAARRVSLDAVIAAARRALNDRVGPKITLQFDEGLLSTDIGALNAAGISVDSLATTLAESARREPGVTRVYTPRSLRAAPLTDETAGRWRRTLPDGYGWLICASIAPGDVWGAETGWTTHGTTNPDDVIVPIVFMGKGIIPGLHGRAVRTTDIAPTLAVLLGLQPLEPLDGRRIPEVTGGR